MNVLDALFGPVSKKYCSLFYYLSMWSLVTYVLALIGAVVVGIKQNKGPSYYVITVLMSFLYLLAYFQNRVLFSMCSR